MLTKTTVADYMSTNLVKVGPDTGINQAIKTLLDHKITSMPVVDAENRLLGCFCERDGMRVFLEATYNQGESGKVGEFMSRNPITVTADASLIDVAVLFQNTQSRSFPVLRNGQLAGMISRIDILKALLSPR